MLSRTKQKWKDYVGIAVFCAVSAFVVGVLVFNTLTTSSQNRDILEGVDARIATLNDRVDVRLTTVEHRIGNTIEQNTVGDRVIVCLLLVEPEDRNENTTQRCVRAARRGDNHLPATQPPHKKWHSTWSPTWAPSQHAASAAPTAAPGGSAAPPASPPSNGGGEPCHKVGHGKGRHCQGEGNNG